MSRCWGILTLSITSFRITALGTAILSIELKLQYSAKRHTMLSGVLLSVSYAICYDPQHYPTQHNWFQNYSIWHSDTRHSTKKFNIQQKGTLCWVMLCWVLLMLIVTTLSIIPLITVTLSKAAFRITALDTATLGIVLKNSIFSKKTHYAEWCYAECCLCWV